MSHTQLLIDYKAALTPNSGLDNTYAPLPVAVRMAG